MSDNITDETGPSSCQKAPLISRADKSRFSSRSSMSKGNTDVSDVTDEQDLCSKNFCPSAKQYRKMEVEPVKATGFDYTWEQTDSDVVVTIRGLSNDVTGALNITFTCTHVNINISDKKHSIKFYDTILKDKSRIQMKKEGITLLAVKQHQGIWPALEAPYQVPNDNQEISNELNHEDSWNISHSNRTVDLEKTVTGQETAGAITTRKDLKEEDKRSVGVEKEEEPVYILDRIKNDFFERGAILTLQIYVKSLGKDYVKINFSKQGFVLKFQTGDPKFLNLNEGTSIETVFTWPVVTRQEIVPDECRFKVKSNVIEVSLRKTTSDRWISLEAPTRKESKDSSKSDSWMPLNKSNIPASAPSSSTCSDSVTAFADKIDVGSKSSSVMFDDMSEIEVADKNREPKRVVISGSSHEREEEEAGTSSYSGTSSKSKSSTSQDWNKPMAKVHPLNNQASDSGTVVLPGYAGLVNLGNTCFMNCVLQVLANTREFRDYFLDGRYQYEINEDNPLGMKGQLAATFGVLLRWLWSCKKYCWEPRKLKDLISKKNPQFFGFAQHDAHEFLAFLLDGLHEDLNRIKQKPYIETVDADGRPDDEVAAEAWAQYKQRNDSVVVDLFQGQYKSKLVCPKCGKISITFDPFLYLSVPLPKKKKIIPVVFMWKESYKKPVRFQVQVSQDDTVGKLIEELSVRTNVCPGDIRVFEAYKGRILKFFAPGTSLTNVDPKDIIIASEVLSEELAGEPVLEIPVMQRTLFPSEYPSRCANCQKHHLDGTTLKRCTKCFKVGYCDHTCQKNHWNLHKSQCSTSPEPIGCPFILSIPSSRATYSNLVKNMEGYSRFSVDVFQPPVKSSEGSTKQSDSAVASNLNSSLSQSCSSLNSLDSLSSASSTCTLTGDQSDPQNQHEGGEGGGDGISSNLNDAETFVQPQSLLSPSSTQTSLSAESGFMGDGFSCTGPGSLDSGLESLATKSSEKVVRTSHVMGVQAVEVERDKAPPTFFIKPVKMEGVGIKGAERLEDKGEQPLQMPSRVLSMDWRNSQRLNPYVLVQSKDLEAEEIDNLNNMAACSNKPTLYQCLELFTEPEILSPEEAWYCPSCKKHVEASKQMAIWQLPHTLIIQLKRFSFQNFLMRSKIKKHLDFPTRDLDMSAFCHGLKHDEPAPVYDLYGVANHHGHLIGGHYTSYVKCTSDGDLGTGEVGWRLCDDSRVSSIPSEKTVVTADAYLLFYRRRGCKAVIGTSSPVGSTVTPHDVDVNSSISGTTIDPNMIFSGLADERTDVIPLLPNINASIKESVNNKLLRDLDRGEASDRTNYENMNLQNLTRGKDCQQIDSNNIYHVAETETAAGESEIMEKGDKEKDVFAFDDELEKESICGEDYDDEDEEEKNRLFIDTDVDLGYTDMEAVD